MSKISRGLVLGYNSGGAIAKYRIAKFGATDDAVLQAAAKTDALMGVSTDVGAGGAAEGIDIVRSGVTPLEYGGAVTRGDLLTSDADGKGISAVPQTAVVSAAITAITKANPGAVSSAAHPFVTGDRVAIAGVGGMVEVNQNVYVVTKTGDDTYTIGVNTSAFTDYTAGGTAIRVAGAAGPVRTIGQAEESGVSGDIGSVNVFAGLVHGS